MMQGTYVLYRTALSVVLRSVRHQAIGQTTSRGYVEGSIGLMAWESGRGQFDPCVPNVVQDVRDSFYLRFPYYYYPRILRCLPTNAQNPRMVSKRQELPAVAIPFPSVASREPKRAMEPGHWCCTTEHASRCTPRAAFKSTPQAERTARQPCSSCKWQVCNAS